MAITSGALNPNLTSLPRPLQELVKTQEKTPELPRNGPTLPKNDKNDKPLANAPKQVAAPPEVKAPAAEGLATLSEELGQWKQDLAGLKNARPSLEPAPNTVPKDAFATPQVAAPRLVQPAGTQADSQFQGRASSRKRETGLDSRLSLVRPRTEGAMPDDLALLDMSEEDFGEAVDLASLTDAREP